VHPCTYILIGTGLFMLGHAGLYAGLLFGGMTAVMHLLWDLCIRGHIKECKGS
jgi:hypothetical protein